MSGEWGQNKRNQYTIIVLGALCVKKFLKITLYASHLTDAHIIGF